jgi:hypothetical protein
LYSEQGKSGSPKLSGQRYELELLGLDGMLVFKLLRILLSDVLCSLHEWGWVLIFLVIQHEKISSPSVLQQETNQGGTTTLPLFTLRLMSRFPHEAGLITVVKEK